MCKVYVRKWKQKRRKLGKNVGYSMLDFLCSAWKEGVAVKCKIYDGRQTFVAILWSCKDRRKGKQLNE